jgi:uncharacterized protein (DUF697 family)
MNKKNLPRAIRPSGAPTFAAGPVPATAEPEPPTPFQHEPLRPHATATAPDVADPPAEVRRAAAMKVVERFSLWSGAAGLIPLPFVDLAAVGGVQIQMLRRISQIYGVPFSQNHGKALIASLAGATIPASSGIGAMSLLKSVPVAGAAVGVLAMPTLSAGATYAIGMAFVEHFASGGTLLDFKSADYREFMTRRLHNA